MKIKTKDVTFTYLLYRKFNVSTLYKVLRLYSIESFTSLLYRKFYVSTL